MNLQPLPNLTSLIVTYHSSSEVCDLLEDLRLHAKNQRIVVIDNASKDGTVERIHTSFPEVHTVENHTNVGYARAVNQGVALCQTEYILLLNPDIRITNPALIPSLLADMERHSHLAVTAPLQYKQVKNQRQLNFTWSYLSPSAFHVYLDHQFQRDHTYEDSLPVTFLNAGCLMLRKSAFLDVGRLNEKYFLYGEEPDLFLKYKRFGYECRLLPQVEVIHFRERSIHKIPTFKRMMLKLRGLYNICDALVAGSLPLLAAAWSNNHTRREGLPRPRPDG